MAEKSCTSVPNTTTRTRLLESYEQLRGALHSPSNWNTSPDINLTFVPTGCGFTGNEQMALFCSQYPANPLNADYINRFNNSCTRVSISVDLEGGSVSEVLLLKTMFQPSWKWMLPHGDAPMTSVILVIHLNVSIKDNKLQTVLVGWDQLNLLNQLGLLPSNKFEYLSAAKMTARLLRPAPGNAQTQFAGVLPVNGKGNILSMSELLTDLPPATPKQPPRVIINPAMVSKGEALFVTPQDGLMNTDIAPSRPHPAITSKMVLGDGADQKPLPSPTSLKSSNPMGTLLDNYVAPLPSRGVNEKFNREMFSDLGQEPEQKFGRADTSGRFSSSILGNANDDVPIQFVVPSTEDKLRADSTRFSSRIFDNEPISIHPNSISMQSANDTRFTSHLLSPSDLLEKEREQRQKRGSGVCEGVLFGQATLMQNDLPSTSRGGTFDPNHSQISFDYYKEKK